MKSPRELREWIKHRAEMRAVENRVTGEAVAIKLHYEWRELQKEEKEADRNRLTAKEWNKKYNSGQKTTEEIMQERKLSILDGLLLPALTVVIIIASATLIFLSHR